MDSTDTQLYIIKGLFENLSYFRNVSVNLEPKYFDEDKGMIVKFVKNYFSQYDKIPEYSIAMNMLGKMKQISDDMRDEMIQTVKEAKKLDFDSIEQGTWLFDRTKEYITERSMFLVLKEGAVEISKEESSRDYGKIQQKMEKALAVSWDEDLGIEFFDETQIDEIYDQLGDHSIRIPVGVDVIDEAINGGIPGKTKFCMVYVGSAGIGKTMILGNTAINAVKDGKNVLYITFEIDQKELRKRLDASFSDYSLRNILDMRSQVKKKISEANKEGKVGRFIIKEFPPASVNAMGIEAFLHTLRLKRQFTPDIIVLDYLGIMVPISTDHKNSYEKGKAICEEIRALSDRFKCPICTAAQTNRSGYGANQVEMDNIADSMGIAHTADLIISLAQPEELKENSQIKFEVIKSRVSKTGSKGIVDVDYDRLKLLSESDRQTENIGETIETGIREIERKKATTKNNAIT